MDVQPVRRCGYPGTDPQNTWKVLSGANHEAGRQSIVWNGQNDRGHNVAAGVYLYSLETPLEKLTGRMSLVK